MKSRTNALYILALITLVLGMGTACSASSSSSYSQNLPGDPHLVVETFTPTPDPLIAGTLTISREGQILGGDAGQLNIEAEIPLQLLYRENAYTGDDLVQTEAEALGVLTMFMSGPAGSGDMTGIWDVTIKVRGILHPAPKCDVELWLEEGWGSEVTAKLTVNGEEVISTVAITDLIPMVTNDQDPGHIIIPKGQTELVEYFSEPAVDWINTYTIELQPQTKFVGCFD